MSIFFAVAMGLHGFPQPVESCYEWQRFNVFDIVAGKIKRPVWGGHVLYAYNEGFSRTKLILTPDAPIVAKYDDSNLSAIMLVKDQSFWINDFCGCSVTGFCGYQCKTGSVSFGLGELDNIKLEGGTGMRVSRKLMTELIPYNLSLTHIRHQNSVWNDKLTILPSHRPQLYFNGDPWSGEFSGYVGGGAGLVGSLFSVSGGHEGRTQGRASDDKADAASYKLPEAPSRSVISGIRRLPLGAKVGAAIGLLGLAAYVWFVGANRSYDRGQGWWKTLLGSLLGGWALALGGVLFIGLCGPY